MIKAKFSKSTGGIYPTDSYSEFPIDSLDIPNALYSKYKEGKIYGFDVVEGSIVELKRSDADANPHEFMEVTSAQAHAAIYKFDKDLYSAITDYMDSPDADMIDKIFWHKAQTFKRLSPTVLRIGALKGLSDDDLDNLFALAKSIDA